jgi:uncharacterized SAM-binding protein YcdF (DUF218 family)
VSIRPVAVLLVSPLENWYQIPPKEEIKKCDAFVVLGGGVRTNAPFLEIKNIPMEDSFIRTMTAVKLHQAFPEKYIIITGYSSSEEVSEAQIVKKLLVYFGVDEKKIITEDKAKDTFQNALYIKKLADLNAFKKICLITSAYHMPRSMFLFQQVGFNKTALLPIPTDYKKTEIKRNIYNWLPKAYWLDISVKALKEYLGLIAYKILK